MSGSEKPIMVEHLVTRMTGQDIEGVALGMGFERKSGNVA